MSLYIFNFSITFRNNVKGWGWGLNLITKVPHLYTSKYGENWFWGHFYRRMLLNTL